MPVDVGLLFENVLHLSCVDEEIRRDFLSSISKYLEHGRKVGVIEGRSYSYLEKHLSELMLLMDAIELSVEERIVVLTHMPALLNTSKDIVTKYLLLGCLENEDNTFRKNKLINKTNDFRVGLKKLYSRYVVACNAGYPDINWNLLVHSTDIEFAQRFVKGAYYKPYQIFDSILEVLDCVERVSLSSLDESELVSWDVNREIVDRYEKRKQIKK